MDPMERMTEVPVPGGATVREVIEDVRLSGRAIGGLRYDREIPKAIAIEPEVPITKVTEGAAIALRAPPRALPLSGSRVADCCVGPCMEGNLLGTLLAYAR